MHTLHRAAAIPTVYNVIQRLAGLRTVQRRLEPFTSTSTGIVLDVGAGTGTWQHNIPGTYLWLDNDRQKYTGTALAVLGDATAIPLADQSVDTALCFAVTHHIPPALLPVLIDELSRVARRVVFMDAVASASPLWRLDRGVYPHSAQALRGALERRFMCEHWDEFQVWHRYVVFVGQH